MKRGPLVLMTLVALLVLALMSIPASIGFLADWYWYQSLNYQTVFLTTLGTKLVLGFGVGALAFGLFYANLRFAQRGMVPDPVVVNINAKAQKVDVTRLLRYLALPLSGLLALVVGTGSASAWLVVLRFLHRTPFGVTDPAFGRDVGYYFFTLPAISAGVGLVFTLALLTLFMIGPLYLLRGDIVMRRRRVTIEPSAERHLAVLVAVIFLAVAVNVFLVRMPALLYSPGGAVFGATYTDLTARIPVLRVSGVVAVLGTLFIAWGLKTHRVARNTGIAVVAYIGVGVIGGVIPAAVQRLVVAPNELARETPFIERHIEATRRAWKLDSVELRTLSGESHLTLADVRANQGTVKNVRLWDRDPLLQTFGQLQEIRTYYDFVSVDDDRYWIDGEYRQVLLSPRELNTASLPTRNFINERLTFTHGMGLTLSPVNQVSQQGLPVLFIQDLPPTSNISLTVQRPQIYYGELSNDYVFVNTRQPEFDYPSADSTATTVYDGEGGVRVNSLFRKALLAARFRVLKIFLSQDITNDSRVLYHRNIRERAAKALPFLQWDQDPYLVISDDGRLKWMLDAYTSGRHYPYAQAMGDGTNYLRNSVKVVIDAYDGDVQAYIADPGDPVIQTYAKIYTGIFRPLDEMPSDLRAHIRYPEDLFRAQTALYTTYHMNEPEIFYHREDQWQIPTSRNVEGARDPFLRHIIMKLPGETEEEFIFMTPFTPRQKDNLAAWMVARNDGEHYGKLVVYRFPRQSLVFGPSQVVNRINQDTEISRQISLWDQRGSEVIRGNLLVIPIEESLIFVQALYLRAEGGRIPELKRVVVAYQDEVMMEETLEEGLARLFGGDVEADSRLLPMELPIGDAEVDPAAPPPLSVASPVVRDLVRQANDHYQRALEAQRDGDWATYGEQIRLVGEALRRLRETAGSVGTGGGGR